MDIIKKFKNAPVTLKATLAYTICSIVQKCMSFITMPLFNRLMSTEEAGIYTIYTSWQAIITIFITLNLPFGSFSKAMLKFEKQRDRYIASCQCICAVLAVLFIGVYIPFSGLWNKLFELPMEYVLLLIGEILTQTAILFWYGKNRFEYKYIAVIIVTLIIAVLTPVVSLILVINSDNHKGYARVIGIAMVYIVIGGAFFINNFIKSGKLYDKLMIKYALSFNLPLIIYYLSQVIFNQSDRIMISHYTGKGDAAIYGVAYSVSVVLVFVLNSINNSYVPWFYEKLSHNDGEENQNISIVIAVIMGTLLLGVIWCAPELTLILGGKKYMEAIWVIPPVTASNMLLLYTQYCINVEFYFEQKKHLIYASILSALINVVLNALLIPRLGFIAAGYTTLISYAMFLGCNYIAMRSVIKAKGITSKLYKIKELGLILVVFMALSGIAMILYHSVLWRYGIIIAVFVVMLVERKKIIPIVKNVFNLKKNAKRSQK